MKILLTGGTGYVGTALRNELRERGHDVRLLVRRSSADKVEIKEDFEVVHGDILDTHACNRAADGGIDAVVNLVAVIRENPADGTTYEALNTEATWNIVQAARRFNVERFVQMSAMGARPDATSRYHTTKFEAERIVEKSGMRWTIFRPTIIFGPDDDFHQRLIDLVHRPVVPIIDGGKALLQPVSLRNVVGAMARSVTMPETQGKIFEVGGPERISFAEMLEKVARCEDVWMNTMKVSSRFMKPVVRMLQRFQSFPLTLDQLTMLLEDNVCDAGEFVKAFGVELDSYLEALPDVVASHHAVAA